MSKSFSPNSGFLHRVFYPLLSGWCFGVCIQFLISALVLVNRGSGFKHALFRASELTTRPYEALIDGKMLDPALFALPAFCAIASFFIISAMQSENL